MLQPQAAGIGSTGHCQPSPNGPVKGFAASDVVPFTHASANLSELADRLDGFRRLERERIHLLLIDDARRGLADIPAGRMFEADAAPSHSCSSGAKPPPRPAAWQTPASARPPNVADPLYRVELTASVLERLDAIETFLVEADAGFAFDDLQASTSPSRPEAAAATVQSAPTAATNKPAAPARPVIAEVGLARKAPPAPPVNKPATKPAAAPSAPAVRPKPTEPPLKATAAARSPTGKNDPDVELLSAIMKHLDQGAGKPAAAARSDQTIADLVNSCQTRDAIEALLCQRRICEGSWGKAQACPPHLAPKSAATAAR